MQRAGTFGLCQGIGGGFQISWLQVEEVGSLSGKHG